MVGPAAKLLNMHAATTGQPKMERTVVGPAADVDDDREEGVEVVRVRAPVHRVAQLQLEGEHHPEHQLAHPAAAGHPHVRRSGAGGPPGRVACHHRCGTQWGVLPSQLRYYLQNAEEISGARPTNLQLRT